MCVCVCQCVCVQSGGQAKGERGEGDLKLRNSTGEPQLPLNGKVPSENSQELQAHNFI